MPSTHIGPWETLSKALLEMLRLVAKVFGEVQIVAVAMMNVIDTATAVFVLNTSRAQGQSGERNMKQILPDGHCSCVVSYTWTGQLDADIPSFTPHLDKILVLFELSPQYSLILFPAVAHVDIYESNMDAFPSWKWHGVGVGEHKFRCGTGRSG
ncbi:predicted protein [Postia placenta Mad-698-R]|uniref:Uncharacterized protein n=1 Tax=Postia placenta MAD-698-R-SB12 TaxID=670580 RepID=A0A1X6MIN2_9APHY|nr:hypothetical protein POSPLADRAFT_1160668 [Postia placenta MAD-698-R-SB12]EED85752.1 predicted protein [Postia placenta Mad-698-R]OSX56195.1 hypothetical protein POSPLADRAFT_1160668 [Postia placenta MAD-698-R-SB12]